MLDARPETSSSSPGRAPAAAAGGRPRDWGETDGRRLGPRVEPAVAALAALAGGRGVRLLDAAAGDGALALAAARAGARVAAVEASEELAERGRARCAAAGADVEWHVAPLERLPFADGAFDAVAAAFAATHHPRPRPAMAELVRVLRVGGTVAVAGWDGLMAQLLAATSEAWGRPVGVRPERWNRLETAQLHFFGFEDLALRRHAMRWTFAGEDEAVAELTAPLEGDPAAEPVRARLRTLLAQHALPAADADGLVVRSAYATIAGRRS